MGESCVSHKPMYTWRLEDARDYGEEDLWRESFKENCRCARAIEQALASNFDGYTLDTSCLKGVLEEFGRSRVRFVLANTLQEKPQDGRFSTENRTWCKGTYVPRESTNWAFTVESHPAVLDGFIRAAKQEWEGLNLYNRTHCVAGDDQDFTGKIVVLRADYFKDQYKTPDYQLFLAESGFGCSPTATGTKVYGRFLKDGEQTNFRRSDIIGILKEELIPQWAADKVAQIYQQEPEENTAMEQTM